MSGAFDLTEQRLLDACRIGLILFDRDGTIVDSNQVAEGLLRMAPAELRGRHLASVLPKVYNVLTRAASTPVSLRVIHNHVSLQATVAGMDVDSQDRWVLTLQETTPWEPQLNIDELQLARELNRELEAIIESSYDGIWVTDGNGVTLRINSAYEKLSGISVDDLIGQNVDNLVSQGYFSDAAALRVLQQKKSVTILSNTRSGKSVLKTGNPIFNDNGEIWRVVVNIRDITELIDLKQQLEETTELYQRYQKEVKVLRQQNLHSDEFAGRSLVTEHLVNLAYRLADVDATVLILGETGVGKGAFTRLIHKLGLRADRPFIEINCGAVPEPLLEAELFGYEKGAFTGAAGDGKPGMFELADHGTLFLDEIGELPLQLQAKLLHVVEERRIRRVGGRKIIDLDFRLIVATNRDLAQMVKEGKFREDLFYRLNVIPVVIPPLRSRPEDIHLLVLHFLEKHNRRYKTEKRILPRAMDRLMNYTWPGNVREIQNLIERLVVLVPSPEIDIQDLPEFIAGGSQAETPSGDEVALLKQALSDLERKLLDQAVREQPSIRQAARRLGISHSSLLRKLDKYALKKE